MRFEWDENKNRQNLLKHDVRFEIAKLVFDDLFAVSYIDDASNNEERWITIGAVGPGLVLVVVHTWFDRADEEVIRIISARAATYHEKRTYAEVHQRAKTRDRNYRSKNGRGH